MNTGSGWSKNNAWLTELNINLSNGGRFMDMNGDGLADFFTNTNTTTKTMLLNTGTEFESITYNPPTYAYSSKTWTENYFPNGNDPGVISVDVNGDGILDIMASYFEDGYNYQETVQKTWLGDGKGNFNLTDDYVPPTLFSFRPNGTFYTGTNRVDFGVRPIDYNADGLTDLIQSTQDSPLITHPMYPSDCITAQRAFLNTGKGWATPFDISLPHYFSTYGKSYPYGGAIYTYGNFYGSGNNELYRPVGDLHHVNLGASADLLNSVTLNQ